MPRVMRVGNIVMTYYESTKEDVGMFVLVDTDRTEDNTVYLTLDMAREIVDAIAVLQMKSTMRKMMQSEEKFFE